MSFLLFFYTVQVNILNIPITQRPFFCRAQNLCTFERNFGNQNGRVQNVQRHYFSIKDGTYGPGGHVHIRGDEQPDRHRRAV